MNRLMTAGVALLACWSFCAAAHAQDIDFDNLTREQQIIGVAAVGVISVSTTTVATVQMSTLESKEDGLKEDIKEIKKFVLMQRYLHTDQHRLEHALSVGGGEALTDLAAMLHVPSKSFAAWSKAMRRRRSTVHHILSMNPTLARARAFYTFAANPEAAPLKASHTRSVQP